MIIRNKVKPPRGIAWELAKKLNEQDIEILFGIECKRRNSFNLALPNSRDDGRVLVEWDCYDTGNPINHIRWLELYRGGLHYALAVSLTGVNSHIKRLESFESCMNVT